MDQAASENSTIVRTTIAPRRRRRPLPLAVRAARAGFRAIGPFAPTLASTYAEHLFLTPRRHRRPAWESSALDRAETFSVPHDGGLLPAWRWGEGETTVLLVHGWEGRGSQLAAFVEPLVKQGFSVVTFDAPGHGDAPAGFASVVDHARAVASVGAHLGRIHAAIGHSVGGAAILFATRFGFAVDRVALIAPPASPARFAAGFSSMLGLTDDVKAGLFTRLERRYGLRMEDLDIRGDAEHFDAPTPRRARCRRSRRAAHRRRVDRGRCPVGKARRDARPRPPAGAPRSGGPRCRHPIRQRRRSSRELRGVARRRALRSTPSLAVRCEARAARA